MGFAQFKVQSDIIMDKRDFAFDKVNYILLAVGMAVVVIGFLLMSGSGSTETAYDADIFSARRIKVAPLVCLIGFVSMIYAVVGDQRIRSVPNDLDRNCYHLYRRGTD